ncbi:MAG TPA: AgmX/PglI C-terminal domain-containing protein, partial [Minicystis sp.]|nr:AgmX/PglI C-terminal domain-containing protein [Minicystis sp.]
GMHPMAYAFIAMAAVFGGVAAYFLFFKPPPPPQVVVVEKTVPAPGSTATSHPASEPQAAAEQPSATPTVAKPQGGGATGRAHASREPEKSPTPSSGGAPIDTSGFNNGGVAGPSAGGPSGNGSGASGTLSQGEIQGVVTSNQARIRRQCWEPALAARSTNAPNTARVNGQLTIGASGSVESASANGADAYPGLASCIAGKMRNWKFPPSGGSQTVNVPFVFAAQ